MNWQPHLQLTVDTWVGALILFGMALPFAIASIGGGYILGSFILGRFEKTVLGIHIRRFFTRIAPSKFFEGDIYDERQFVQRCVVEELSKNGRLRDLVKEVTRG